MLTSQIISGTAGALLSLAFERFPGLHDRFDILTSQQKQLIMILLVLTVSGLAVLGVADETTDWTAVLVEVLTAVFAAATGNQVMHRLVKQ